MNRIILKKMSLRNFKGIRDLDMELREDVTSILGKNGSGKTTLFDAFTWVLFGKDSRDREKFQLMTLDTDGQEIPRLQHEVTLTLLVNGKEVVLTRRKNEKWTKRRGSAIEEKTGTEEERLYNDIPCSVKEWDEKIQAICPYEVFKYITSPTYFTSQKADVQREILFRMVGNISDSEVAEALGNPDFCTLVQQLDDKTMDEYKREIGAKKKRIKTELDEYPIRIKECNSVIDGFVDTDFAAIEQEIADKKQKIADINANLSSAKKSITEGEERIRHLSSELNRVSQRRIELEYQARRSAEKSYHEAENERSIVAFEIKCTEREISQLLQQIDIKTHDVATLTKRREECIAELKEIQSTSLTFSQDDFRCPTCGQTLEVKDIEAKKSEMTRRFNEDKANKLAANKERGMQCSKTLIAETQAEISTLTAKLNESKAKLEEKKSKFESIKLPTLPTQEDIDEMLNKSAEYALLVSQEDKLKQELSTPSDTKISDDAAEMSEARDLLQSSLYELNQILGKKAILEKQKSLVKTYEEKMRKKAEELAELEGIEFTIMEFAKAKVEAVEKLINSLFSIVKFKMFDYQLNGGWRETCEATVNGVPYSSLNSAMRINAGLDIINAICKFYDTSAPVFIDNAESVNDLLPMKSQVVRLVVTTDSKLIIN